MRKAHNKGVFTSKSYSSVHKWMSRWHKKKDSCEHCPSKKFLEWALRHGCQHEHKPENYLTLCSSCHKKYDYNPERRQKLSEAMKGRKITWAKTISKALTGRKLSKKHRQKISELQKQNPRPRNEKGQFYSAPTRVSLAGRP